MKKTWIFIISIGLVVGLLSGCSQIEEILGKVNQVLDEQISEEGDGEPANNEEGNNSNATTESDDEQDENEQNPSHFADSELPFDERLLSQGYDRKVLPNGFSFDVPYHWILVEENLGDPDAENFNGMFCFDIPMDIEQVAEEFGEHYDVEHEHHGEGNDIIHTTNFTTGLTAGDWSGTLEYFIDEHGNTCADVEIIFVEGEYAEVQTFYGEDPSTMVSEEELAQDVEITENDEDENNEEENENENENEDTTYGNRDRSVPDDYEEILNLHRVPGDVEDMDFDADDMLSIRERIRSEEMEMLHLLSGFPRIFPYEWYLLEENDDPMNGSWSGTFCTDAPMRQAITKHHDMLADHQADIIGFNISESPQMLIKGDVIFDFNDEYGTGSWRGETLFYIDRSDEFQTHKCIDLSMKFSPELLP